MRIVAIRRGLLWFLAATMVAAGLSAGVALAQPKPAKAPDAEVQRGRYLAQIAGCNDCHTPDYAMKAGKVDEKTWLTGDALGSRGPWGTTYPANLRRLAPTMTEAQWLMYARQERRPPMPWFALRDMSDRDVRAIYRYLRHLGPAGEAAPAYVPPDKEPKGPVILFPAPPK